MHDITYINLTTDAEEILEHLWLCHSEGKQFPDLQKLKATPGYDLLIEKEMIDDSLPHYLTEKGLREGMLCVRRHRLAERLLVDVLKVENKNVHDASCRLEHILQKGLEDQVCTLLGHPRTCPHGKPIPPGECCTTEKKEDNEFVEPLSRVKKKQRVKVAYIETDDEEIMRKILAMGLHPGKALFIIQQFPTTVFEIGNSQFAIDNDIAEKIMVWVK